MESTQLAVNEGSEVVVSGPAPAVLNQEEVPVTTAPEISTIPAVEGAFRIPSALTVLAKQFLSPVFGNMTMDHLKATMRSFSFFLVGCIVWNLCISDTLVFQLQHACYEPSQKHPHHEDAGHDAAGPLALPSYFDG